MTGSKRAARVAPYSTPAVCAASGIMGMVTGIWPVGVGGSWYWRAGLAAQSASGLTLGCQDEVRRRVTLAGWSALGCVGGGRLMAGCARGGSEGQGRSRMWVRLEALSQTHIRHGHGPGVHRIWTGTRFFGAWWRWNLTL